MGSTIEGHGCMSHTEEVPGGCENSHEGIIEPDDAAVDQDVITPLASEDNNPKVDNASQDRSRQDYKNNHGQQIPTATGVHGSLSLDGYYQSLQHKPSWRIAKAAPTSTQSSSGSLHALSEHGEQESGPSMGRTLSTRSISGRSRGRSASHSKSNSISGSASKRLNVDHPFYPEQSFASLSNPMTTARPHPILRTRSSHPAQNLLYNDMSTGSKLLPSSGRKTADNTPISSPGLFTPTSVKAQFDLNRTGSPQLHHLQAPKETDRAEIDHDMFSGNKFINHYEVVHELGRGEHGKVKLGRDMERDSFVAIKIVPRYSVKRRLGKLGAPEDRTKREVAILKKARHPHVVSLLEVIDDPNKNKVYLILEFVEKGEIKWRKHGVKEICAINNRRFDEERLGLQVTLEPTDRDNYTVRQAKIRHERLEYARTHGIPEHVPNWSLEYAGDTDDESEHLDLTRTISRQMTGNSIPSRGNSQDDYVGTPDHLPSYGSFTSDHFRNHRKFSVAASAVSHMSSEVAVDQDDDQHSFVPALTMEEAKRTFRDTLLGLEFLHFIGIIHRDIKPANLLASSNGQVKISDFGVSYLGRPTTEEEADNKVAEKDATPLDNEKELARSVGTPAFWAPEVCYEDASMFADGKDPKITGALDLWALGITLYCMIYARLPFYGGEYMGLHEAVCTEEVFCPRTRLVPVDTTSSEFISRSTVPINGSKRLDYELKFEQVPDHVRDLIRRLLTKDPAYRITIDEAKRHPWVVEGISDQTEWLHSPEIEIGGKKILEINDKELSHAVVKRSFIERGLSAASRIAGSLLGRSKDGRKRSTSTVTSAGSSTESLHSPATSTTSTVGKVDKVKEARRQSLRGEELVQALKASREPSEHPLAQSQTASPEIRDQPQQSYFAPTKSLSTGHTPAGEHESRPRGPDRGLSVLSTAESVKTIRASQFQRGPMSDTSSSTEVPLDSSLRSRVEGLWEGTTKSFTRLGSRDRRPGSRSRSRGRAHSESDGHAGPSLAVSKMYAAGAIQTPNVLKAIDSEKTSPAQSPTHHSPFRAPASAEFEYEQAQQINTRRHIQEAQYKIEAASRDRRESVPDECPPSPDDIVFLEQSIPSSTQMSPPHMGAMQTAQSASTIASSIGAFDNSSVSAPSYGINSGASSPPEGGLASDHKEDTAHRLNAHTSEHEPEFMRTADTVTLHGRPVPAIATGKPLQEEHEYYDYDEDEDEDSEEEGIVMGGLGRA